MVVRRTRQLTDFGPRQARKPGASREIRGAPSIKPATTALSRPRANTATAMITEAGISRDSPSNRVLGKSSRLSAARPAAAETMSAHVTKARTALGR